MLFLAKPCPESIVQEKYGEVVEVRDNCFAISKKNVSRQLSDSYSASVSNGFSRTERGLLQEFASQVINKFRFNNKMDKFDLFDSIYYGGINSGNQNNAETDSFSVADSIAHDIQNGFALEMMEYCDKAIERLRLGLHTGMWSSAIVYSAESDMVAKIIQSCLAGELSKPSKDTLPFRSWTFSLHGTESIRLPKYIFKDAYENPLCVSVTSEELGMICTPPFSSVPDFELKQGKLYPMIGSTQDGITIGKVADGNRALPGMNFSLSEADLNKHTFVCGITGSGKTTTVKRILQNCKKPFMVIESAKKEYRNMSFSDNRDVKVYTLGKPELNCLQFNPFYIQYGINLQTHIDYLKDLFNASFSFYGPMPYILEKCLNNVYQKKGWNLTLGYHPYLVNLDSPIEPFNAEYMKQKYALKSHSFLFPTMEDLKNEIKRYIEVEMQYDSEVGGNIKTAILARLESLCIGSKGYMLNNNIPFDAKGIMEENVVFELEGLADDSDKAFCVGLLVIFINEYRQVFKEEHPTEKLGLKHLLVIEEAHRLLKNVETERSSENMGNPKGKAVEHFTNMIAEMRSYGQGVIIAEQIPSKLAPDVIKNSSNKIIQRIVSADDQSLIANTIGIKEEDAVYMGNLKTGFALCHKEGMSLPVFVKIDPVADDYVSDSTLFSRRNKAVFESLNYNMIKETLSGKTSLLELKLLNTLLADKEVNIIRAIKECKEHIERQLIKADVTLVLCNNFSDLCGRVLAESIMEHLISGVYRVHRLLPDDVYSKLLRLCEKGLIEDIAPLRKELSKLYSMQCKNFCVRVITELIHDSNAKNVNVDESIRAYFFPFVDPSIVRLIHSKI